MSDESSDPDRSAKCPICGGRAERGCIYGSDKGWSLRWFPGPPGFWANVSTGLGGGEVVGDFGFGTGPYAEGIWCLGCRKIVIDC